VARERRSGRISFRERKRSRGPTVTANDIPAPGLYGWQASPFGRTRPTLIGNSDGGNRTVYERKKNRRAGRTNPLRRTIRFAVLVAPPSVSYCLAHVVAGPRERVVVLIGRQNVCFLREPDSPVPGGDDEWSAAHINYTVINSSNTTQETDSARLCARVVVQKLRRCSHCVRVYAGARGVDIRKRRRNNRRDPSFFCPYPRLVSITVRLKCDV